MLDPLGPGNIGDMDQAVDVIINADEHTEVRNIFNLTLNGRAYRVLLADHLPRIRHGLLHAERYAPAFRLDIEHHGFHFFAHTDDFRGMPDFSGPGHLGHV